MWRIASAVGVGILLLAGRHALGEDRAAAEAGGPWLIVATSRFGGMQLMTLDVNGKHAVQLTRDTGGAVAPTWAPDGKKLAFVSYRTGQAQIFTLDGEGKETRLSDNSGMDRNPAWSPLGDKIVFGRIARDLQEDVWIMDADGANKTNLSKRNGENCDPSWSSDGKQIAFCSGRWRGFRIWTMKSDGGEPKNLVDRNEIGALYPAWSADNKQIVYGGAAGNSVQLHVMNADGTGIQQLTRDARQCSYAAWSPDGQYIAYIRFQRWPGRSDPSLYKDADLPKADLVVFDTLSDAHTTISTGDIIMWGPRPAWKPVPRPANESK